MDDENGLSDSSGGGAETGPGRQQRACDSCRARKVRCDKGSPCSSCRASNSVCRTSQAQKPKRQRILISSQYEKKIDAIDNRLAGIEQVLRNLTLSLDPLQRGPPTSSTQPRDGIDGPLPKQTVLPIPLTSNSCATFEGDNTLNAQSVFATEILERAVDSGVFAGQNPEILEALTSLRGIINRLSHHPEPDKPIFADRSFSAGKNVELPPQDAVLSLLEITKVRPSLTFTQFLPFLPMQKFAEICSDVYRQNGNCPQGRLVLFFGGLSYLIEEYNRINPASPGTEVYPQYLTLCRRNFEVLLSSMPLLIAPTLENIQALLLGGTHGVELSKPSLCWAFTSTAAGFCQSLGYHRRESMKADTTEDRYIKIIIFWFVYIMDKNLSLRLGRASTIQDYDISVPQPAPGSSEWPPSLWYWIKFAETQGQVYEQLYSPGAFSKTDEERSQIAKSISMSLQEAFNSRYQFDDVDDSAKEFTKLLVAADEVTYHSLLTLIYRAIPPVPNNISTTLNHECIEAARRALRAHQLCRLQYKDRNEELWSGYLNWAILNAPFTPFMIIFCHVIAVYDSNDLQLLTNFVSSLYPNSSTSYSEGAEKLHRLCHVFYQVAKLYFQAKTEEAQTQAQIKGSNSYDPGAAFDPYLNMLGFAPNQGYAMAGFSDEDEGQVWQDGNEFDVAMNVQNWFTGNQSILGLLEQDVDFTNIDM